jgi:hypothetical protein
MSIEEAKAELEKIISGAVDDNLWGGHETPDGCLMPGRVDWDKFRRDVSGVIDRLANPGDERRRSH